MLPIPFAKILNHQFSCSLLIDISVDSRDGLLESFPYEEEFNSGLISTCRDSSEAVPVTHVILYERFCPHKGWSFKECDSTQDLLGFRDGLLQIAFVSSYASSAFTACKI